MKLSKIVLVTFPKTEPVADNYKVVEEDIRPIEDGECLVKMLHLSVDPYMRIFMAGKKIGDTVIGQGVGVVIESRNQYAVGAKVLVHSGWATHAIARSAELQLAPETGSYPLSYTLGVLGMPGCTAYVGVHTLLQVKPGETLFVNTAAGAVGLVVGQLARAAGARVVGCTGSDSKVELLLNLGFDAAFNYKKESNIDEALTKYCPEGIDCFFENVGGPDYACVFRHMKAKGRICICGQISCYNLPPDQHPLVENPMMHVLMNELTVRGLSVYNHAEKVPAAVKHMLELLQEGKLKYTETVFQGFDKMVEAFIAIFKGTNTGKAIVSLGGDEAQ